MREDRDQKERSEVDPTVAECRRLAHIIVSRRYYFEMPSWLWDVTPDEDLEWVLTHYLMGSTVAYKEACETIEMYKGARRYRLQGKVTYHSVSCDW